MARSFRLTRRAEDSLVDIARWTIDRFGPRQAELYKAELLARCEAIAGGEAHSRSCSVLLDAAQHLKYLRAGEHFLVFVERPEEVIIVDVLHSRSDLPRHIAALTTRRGEDG
ncbi:MAG: type II toxin-antitoxin system RelE/ParE family toxin [Pseudomonadota bacterium]